MPSVTNNQFMLSVIAVVRVVAPLSVFDHSQYLHVRLPIFFVENLFLKNSKKNLFVQLGFSVSRVTHKKVQLNTDLLKHRGRYLYTKGWRD
jgi:hypothetical protein